MRNGQSKRAAALYIALVFLAGAAFGFASNRFYTLKIAQATNGRLSPEEYRARLLQELTSRLNLNGDQQTRVEAIMDEIGERFHAVRDAMEPEFQAIRGERAARIMEVLDEEQGVEYERILEERRKKREANAHHHR